MNTQPQDKKTVIAGITVELEFTSDGGEVVSSCFLSKQTRDGLFSGSLTACEYEGGIPYDEGSGEDDGPSRYALSPETLNRIAAWAEDNGY